MGLQCNGNKHAPWVGGIPLSPCRGTIMALLLSRPGLFGAPQSLPSVPPCWIARVCRGGVCRGPAVLGSCFACAGSPPPRRRFGFPLRPPPRSSHTPKGLQLRMVRNYYYYYYSTAKCIVKLLTLQASNTLRAGVDFSMRVTLFELVWSSGRSHSEIRDRHSESAIPQRSRHLRIRHPTAK